jgi:hypothetical protein
MREYDQALLFRKLATLRTDIELFEGVEQLRWKGETPAFAAIGKRFNSATTQPKKVPVRRAGARSGADAEL